MRPVMSRAFSFKRKETMITLEANYSKKLGLPGYSSHQYSLTVRTEVSDISQVEKASQQLFATLQSNVDRDIQNTGFLPGNNGNGNGQRNGSNGQGNGNGSGNGNGHRPSEERWNCSDKQRDLILKIVEESKLDKSVVEALAQERFGQPVKKLNKLEASGLIEELFERTGGKGSGDGRYSRAGGRGAPPSNSRSSAAGAGR
jgi:hypothetical protein